MTLLSITSNPVTTGQVYPPKSTHRMTVVNLTVTGLFKFKTISLTGAFAGKKNENNLVKYLNKYCILSLFHLTCNAFYLSECLHCNVTYTCVLYAPLIRITWKGVSTAPVSFTCVTT